MKRNDVVTILIGTGLGLCVLICLTILLPYVVFFGPFLLLPIGVCIVLTAPITRSDMFSRLSRDKAIPFSLAFMIVAIALPFLSGFAEAYLREPPLPLPENAEHVRHSSFAGEYRVWYTLDDSPDAVARRLRSVATDAGWIDDPGHNSHARENRNPGYAIFEKVPASDDRLVVRVTGTEDAASVFIFRRTNDTSPALLLLLVFVGYALSLFFALTHPKRDLGETR